MAQTINMHHDFHRSPLPTEMMPDRVVNPNPFLLDSTDQPAADHQSLIELRADVELPEFCDSKDVVIAVLEGRGSLMVQEGVVHLEPELFVFVPTQTRYRLQIDTNLMLLLSQYEPDLTSSKSVWIVHL